MGKAIFFFVEWNQVVLLYCVLHSTTAERGSVHLCLSRHCKQSFGSYKNKWASNKNHVFCAQSSSQILEISAVLIVHKKTCFCSLKTTVGKLQRLFLFCLFVFFKIVRQNFRRRKCSGISKTAIRKFTVRHSDGEIWFSVCVCAFVFSSSAFMFSCAFTHIHKKKFLKEQIQRRHEGQQVQSASFVTLL